MGSQRREYGCVIPYFARYIQRAERGFAEIKAFFERIKHRNTGRLYVLNARLRHS